MNSRSKRDMARKIVSIRDVQKLIADQERMTADQEVVRQEGIVREASSLFEQARSEWDEHMNSGRLLPEFMKALASEVIDRQQAFDTAGLVLREAQREQDVCVRRAATSAGLREQAGQVLKQARREIAMQDQERVQTALEERTAYEWSRS